jgi:hypothetical protein
MKTIRPWMIAASLAALMLVSGFAGLLIGTRMTREKITRQNNPETWNETAMRTFARTVRPTSEQSDKIQVYLNTAIQDLIAIRASTIDRSSNVVWRLIGEVEKELTPEQRIAFDKMKPTQNDLSSLDVLQVDPKK